MPTPSFKDILMKGVKTNKDEALQSGKHNLRRGVKTNKDEALQSGKHNLRRKTLSSFLGQDVGELVRQSRIYDVDRDYCGPGRDNYTVPQLVGAPVAFLFVRASGFTEFMLSLRYFHVIRCMANMISIASKRFEVVFVPMPESSPRLYGPMPESSPDSAVPMPESSPDQYSWMLVAHSNKSNQEHLIPLLTHFFGEGIALTNFTLALVTFGPSGRYHDQGIIYTNSSEDAYQLFLGTFPFGDKAKKLFESLHSRYPMND